MSSLTHTPISDLTWENLREQLGEVAQKLTPSVPVPMPEPNRSVTPAEASQFPTYRGARADNWADRSTYKCLTCMFNFPKQGPVGRCRRHAPTIEGWPVVYETDVCGDHKLDASRI